MTEEVTDVWSPSARCGDEREAERRGESEEGAEYASGAEVHEGVRVRAATVVRRWWSRWVVLRALAARARLSTELQAALGLVAAEWARALPSEHCEARVARMMRALSGVQACLLHAFGEPRRHAAVSDEVLATLDGLTLLTQANIGALAAHMAACGAATPADDSGRRTLVHHMLRDAVMRDLHVQGLSVWTTHGHPRVDGHAALLHRRGPEHAAGARGADEGGALRRHDEHERVLARVPGGRAEQGRGARGGGRRRADGLRGRRRGGGLRARARRAGGPGLAARMLRYFDEGSDCEMSQLARASQGPPL